MAERTCPECGGLLSPRATFCSSRCTQRAEKSGRSTKRPCSVDGCARAHRAKGLCHMHYRHATGRHEAPSEIPCAHCGVVVAKRKRSDRQNQFCSFKCRDDFKFGADRHFAKSAELVPVGTAYEVHSCAVPTGHPARVPTRLQGVFVSGACAWCGGQFVACDRSRQAKFCSDRCKLNSWKGHGRFRISPRIRRAIYDRDHWTCQLCFDPVDPILHPSDPWAATLDHILCQSWMSEPDHSPDNLRLAHRWCNSVRGDESIYSAADLVVAS